MTSSPKNGGSCVLFDTQQKAQGCFTLLLDIRNLNEISIFTDLNGKRSLIYDCTDCRFRSVQRLSVERQSTTSHQRGVRTSTVSRNNVIHSCLSGEPDKSFRLFCFDLVRVADPQHFLTLHDTGSCSVICHLKRQKDVLSSVCFIHTAALGFVDGLKASFSNGLVSSDDNWCPTFLLSVLGSPWTKNGPVTCRPSFIRPR